MFSPLQFTLYELFGYLIPGSVAALGIALVWCTVFAVSPPFAQDPPRYMLIGLLVASYMLGHLLHAGVNLLHLSEPPEVRALGGRHRGQLIPEVLLEAIDRSLFERYQIDSKKLPAVAKYFVMDEARVQIQVAGDREVYIYREGFYGGMVIASAILAIGLLIRFQSSQPISLLGEVFSSPQIFALFLLSVIAIPLWLQRWRHFGELRVVTAASRWLAIASRGGTGGPT